MSSSRVLENIRNQARRNIGLLSPLQTTIRSEDQPSLTLPAPLAIADRLIRSGWTNKAANYISDVFIQHANNMKLQFEKMMNADIEACLNTGSWQDAQPVVERIHANFLAHYQKNIASWTQRASHLSQRRMSEILQGSSERKKPNSQRFASVLEQAFQDNPYPAENEKRALATLVGLEYKQVNIWFQNKRSRCRREGKPIHKFSLIVANGDVSRALETPVTPPPLRPLSSKASTISIPPCPFSMERAPHAFPNTFPPICEDDLPYSPRTFDTPWPRHIDAGSQKSEANHESIDITQLCASLSHMALKEELFSAETPLISTHHPGRLRDYAAACFPPLILPPTAPLPSLLPIAPSVHTLNYGQTIRSPPLLSSHLIHDTTTLAASTRRTSTLRLPRKLARDSAHPYRSRALSRPKTHHARLSRFSAPSLTSDGSEDNCLSRASSASLESPPPLTPPQLLIELAYTRKVSSSNLVPGASQDLDHLFSDSDASTLSLPKHQLVNLY